jgi:hypothetical protein
MKDTLSVRAIQQEDGRFLVCWKWRVGQAKNPVMGKIAVTIDSSHTNDRAALAEIRALYYLLEDRQIHGPRRLGNNLRIEVSSGAIRKSLRKGSLKCAGVGTTSKDHIAAASTFLATKYFEAKVDVAAWRDEEPKAEESIVELMLGAEFPQLALECPLMQAKVGITRHAMHRVVARIDQKLDRYSEDDLLDVPDTRWSAAWRWLEGVLANPNLCVPKLTQQAYRRTRQKYGDSSFYLHFPDAQAIFIGVKERGGRANIVSALREDVYRPFIQLPKHVSGQRLIGPREAEAIRWRNRQKTTQA